MRSVMSASTVSSCTLMLVRHQRRQLRRQLADAGRLDAVAVDQARHLDARSPPAAR